MLHLTKDVAIVSAAQTKFGEHWEESLRSMSAEAVQGVLRSVEKGFDPRSVDGIIVGNAGSGELNGQNNLGALVADQSGLGGKPAFKVEASGASGGLALAQGYAMIRAGLWDTVLVVGVEKMTDQTRSSSIITLKSSALDAEWETLQAQTEASAFAMVAQAYFAKFPNTDNRAWLASVAVKNHQAAVYNKYAHFRRGFKLEQVMGAAPVAEPLGLLDCAPASDGAAAVLLTKSELAKNYTDTPVYLAGVGQATDTIALHDRPDLAHFQANVLAGKQAFKMAGLDPKDVQVAEMFDNYSITEVLSLENLGFFEPGQAGPATLAGQTSLNSEGLVVNPSGGLKALGHPVGATGVAQAAELFWQLRGEVEQERRTNAEVGLTHSVGGVGSTVSVNIFQK